MIKMKQNLMVLCQAIIYQQLRLGNIMNLDECKSTVTYWIALYVNIFNSTYCNSGIYFKGN